MNNNCKNGSIYVVLSYSIWTMSKDCKFCYLNKGDIITVVDSCCGHQYLHYVDGKTSLSSLELNLYASERVLVMFDGKILETEKAYFEGTRKVFQEVL